MGQIRAGLAKVDITPPLGTTMDGYASRTQLSEGIHDRLYCRAIVLADPQTSVAIVSCDLCWLAEETIRDVRDRSTASGIDHLLLSVTHNHSGPATVDFLAPPSREGVEYTRNLSAHIDEAVRLARERLQPIRFTLGHGEATISVNRRGVTGEVDPEVLTVMITSLGGEPLGEVLSYACHPTVLGEQSKLVSGDYPGLTTEKIEKHFGGDFVCLFLNGACGDINPRTCQGYKCLGTFDDATEMAQELASASLNHSEFKQLQDFEKISFDRLNVGPLPPFGLQFELEALALGDLVILGIPGELFASTGQWLKRHSITPNLVISCYTGGYTGYLPSKEAFSRKDYETQSVCWVDESAEAEVVKGALTLVERVARPA